MVPILLKQKPRHRGRSTGPEPLVCSQIRLPCGEGGSERKTFLESSLQESAAAGRGVSRAVSLGGARAAPQLPGSVSAAGEATAPEGALEAAAGGGGAAQPRGARVSLRPARLGAGRRSRGIAFSSEEGGDCGGAQPGEAPRGSLPPARAPRSSGPEAGASEPAPAAPRRSRASHASSGISDSWELKAFRGRYELFAAAAGNVEWLRFCLNRNHAEISADDKGFTAIHFAAQRGKLECLRVLVEEYSFPVDSPTEGNQTPLHLVIHRSNKTRALPCIQYLLQKGAAINTQTCNGYTPLHLAAREGLLGCVKVLVQSGADVHARDALGCKAIDHCRIWNHRACARFLKDAMWRRDKKDFAQEMGKLKTLKDQLMHMEHSYLIEHQKECKLLREADFRKWLRSKLLHPSCSQVSNTKQEEAGVPLDSTALSKTPRPKNFFPSAEARLQDMLQPMVPPPKPIYRNPQISRPKMWNLSNNPSRSPTTDLRCPQGIRLGIHPDRSWEHNFCHFLEVIRAPHGGARLLTEDGHWVAPVPKLPYEVILRVLHPGTRPYRMKVPQGFYPLSILRTPQRRHWGDSVFWTDALAMNLCDTFDETFLATLEAHQGLPCLPSPESPP